jgi:DNA-binding NtrC family response regulator
VVVAAAHEADLVADGARYGMIGRSATMRRIYQLVEMAAPTKCGFSLPEKVAQGRS